MGAIIGRIAAHVSGVYFCPTFRIQPVALLTKAFFGASITTKGRQKLTGVHVRSSRMFFDSVIKRGEYVFRYTCAQVAYEHNPRNSNWLAPRIIIFKLNN